MRKVSDNKWSLYQEIKLGKWVLRHTASYPTELFKYLADHVPWNTDIDIETHTYMRHDFEA